MTDKSDKEVNVKMDKKIVAKQKRNKDYSTLIVEQDKLIMSLNETYNKLDYDNFLEKLNNEG